MVEVDSVAHTGIISAMRLLSIWTGILVVIPLLVSDCAQDEGETPPSPRPVVQAELAPDMMPQLISPTKPVTQSKATEPEALAPALVSSMGPQEVTDSYVRAFNDGDIDALSALYDDDVVRYVDGDVSTGKAEVVANDLDAIADHGTLTFYGMFIGDTLIGNFHYLHGNKEEFDTGMVQIVVRDGKITTIIIEEAE